MESNIFQKHGDKLLFILALAVLATALLRLGTKSEPIPPVEPSMIFSHWEGAPEAEILQALIKEFESLHEGIKITLETRSYEELRDLLFNQAEVESIEDGSLEDGSLKETFEEPTEFPGYIFPGDILIIDPLWVPELIEREIIENTRNEGRRNESRRNENPIISFKNVMYYNIEILREAGFNRPPRSREEFLNYARALSSEDRPNGVQSLVLGAGSSRGIYDDIYPWIWAAGAELIRNGQPALNSQPIINSLAFLATLNREGLIAPGAFSNDADEKLEGFVHGRAAFMIAPSSHISFVREKMGDEAFGITSVPIPENFIGVSFFGSAGWMLGVNSASAYRDEARLFVNFLTERASLFSELSMAVPGNGIPLPSQDPFYTKLMDLAIAAEPEQDFAGMPWSELEAIFREELLGMFEERSNPAETAAAIQRRWTERLADW